MTEWKCTRCGKTDVSHLEKAPFPGTLGTEIQEKVCATCWDHWDQARVMILNEYHLNMGNPEHFSALLQQMKYFLGLEEPPENPA